MDVKRSARQASVIAKVSELLDVANVRAWLGGRWAQEGQGGLDHGDQGEIVFYIFAADAPQVRIILTEGGFDIVDCLPNSFAAVRGRFYIGFTILWVDEHDQVVTYDDRFDQGYHWPRDAFPEEKALLLKGVAVRAVGAAAWRDNLLAVGKGNARMRQKQSKDFSRLKSLVHDRM